MALLRPAESGKRARAETGIDGAGRSLVNVAVELAAARLGAPPGAPAFAGRAVLIVGAGSMSALAARAAARSQAASIVIANRTRRTAERLAAQVGATVTALADLPDAMMAADVVICCTGAVGPVVTREMVPEAARARPGPLVFLDLAMPRDVEPAVAGLPGVIVIGMDQLSEHETAASADDVAAVRAICEAELAAYQSAVGAARVAPTVVALRAKAATVVDAELTRLVEVEAERRRPERACHG